MIKKTLVSLTAAVVLAIGLGAAQPAAARVFISIGVPYLHHNYLHCGWKSVKVKVWSNKKHKYVWVWSQRRVCW
jgi:hypothetical protein